MLQIMIASTADYERVHQQELSRFLDFSQTPAHSRNLK